MNLAHSLTIVPLPALKDNYIWCIVPLNSRQCVIIDPGEAFPVIQFLNQHQLSLSAIWITHHHWDHTNGIEELIATYHAPVYGSARDPLKHCDYFLKENDLVYVNDTVSFRVIEIPGHTQGHLAYYGEGAVFTGDTLFTGGCGRIFEGTPEQMFDSLQKLIALPEDTLVYCGHEYTEANLRFAHTVEPDNLNLDKRIKETASARQANQPTVPASLLLEKQTNPFLRVTQPTIINSISRHSRHCPTQAKDAFKLLREYKNSF